MGQFEIEVDLSAADGAEAVDSEMPADSERGNQSVELADEAADSEMTEDSEVSSLWAEVVAGELGKVAPGGLPGLETPYIAVAMEHWQSPFAVVQVHKTAAAVALVAHC